MRSKSTEYFDFSNIYAQQKLNNKKNQSNSGQLAVVFFGGLHVV